MHVRMPSQSWRSPGFPHFGCVVNALYGLHGLADGQVPVHCGSCVASQSKSKLPSPRFCVKNAVCPGWTAGLQSKQSGVAGAPQPGASEVKPSPSQSQTSPVAHAMAQPASASGWQTVASEHVGPPLPDVLELVAPDEVVVVMVEPEDVEPEPTVAVVAVDAFVVAPVVAVAAPPAPSVDATSGVQPVSSVAAKTSRTQRRAW